MARPSTAHVCAECGHSSARWHGQCPGCRAWNTLVEERAGGRVGSGAGGRGRGGGAAAAPAGRPVRLADVSTERVPRMLTAIGELDRVLGGGLVPGSLVLLGGSPGIGKSTITTSALGNLAQSGQRVLYVSGEESAAQVRLRAERLGTGALTVPIVAETDPEAGTAAIEGGGPEGCGVDS